MELCPKHKNRQLTASGYCQDCGSYPTANKTKPYCPKCKEIAHLIIYTVAGAYQSELKAYCGKCETEIIRVD